MQRPSLQHEWCHDGDVSVCKFATETVFLENCLVAPTPGPIEFRNNRLLVFDADLINAILVAVQGQESPVAAKIEFLHRRENVVGLKLGVCER